MFALSGASCTASRVGAIASSNRPDLRSTPSHGYVIFFRYTADAIEIVNLLHASRDILTHFDEH